MKKLLISLSIILFTISFSSGIQHPGPSPSESSIGATPSSAMQFTGNFDYSRQNNLIDIRFSENIESPNFTIENNTTYPSLANETYFDNSNESSNTSQHTNSTNNFTQKNNEKIDTQNSDDSDSRYIVIDSDKSNYNTTNQTSENQTETPQSSQNQSKNQTKISKTEGDQENSDGESFLDRWRESQSSEDADNGITGDFSSSKTYLKQVIRYITGLISNLSV